MPHLTDDDIRQRYGLPPDARVRRSSGPADKPLQLVPDSFTVHEVESALDSAAWERPVVVAGTTVCLSVQGVFVGEGSPLAVSLHDARGAALGRGAGPMHRDRAVVEIAVDRRAAEREPDGVLAAADIKLTELGLSLVSPPLLVLPFAELTRAAWSVERTEEGATVGLSCRIEGSAAGVERLGREPAEVAVFVRTESGETPLNEPVVAFQSLFEGGKLSLEWTTTLALDRWALLSQAEHDLEADRVEAARGSEGYVYDRPSLIFQVRLAGIEAESGLLAIDDWVELRHRSGGRPADGRPYTLTLADATSREGTLDADGYAREGNLPPGPVVAMYETVEEEVADDDSDSTPPTS